MDIVGVTPQLSVALKLLEIKFLIGIIPVSHFEKRLHGNARHVFQNGRSKAACHVSQKQIVLKWHGNHQQHNGAASVQRQKRPVHKASVGQLSRLDGDVRRLKAPSKKAIEIKEKDPLRH
jgi:hypothetical protein